MLRDTRRDVDYFNKWISFYKESNERSIARLPNLELASGIGLCVYRIFIGSLNICILQYGRGDNTNAIKNDIEKIMWSRGLLMDTLSILPDNKVQKVYADLDLYTYYNIFSWFSFLVYTKAGSSTFKQAFKAIGDLQNDSLLIRLYELLTGEDESPIDNKNLIYPKIYSRLLDVFEAAESERPVLMKKFIDNWYESMRPIAWHNNDKGGEGAYFGYWCFEAALVVNLLSIDDSSFRDNVYYPKDLIIRA